uniref:Galectin n=1 Tax=Meloidogyne incognita TaxID=6306 RepID=A0A914N8N5_MELIC
MGVVRGTSTRQKKEVIRDTWIRGKGWIRTERSGGFPFTVGQPFQLEFRAAPRNTIHIYVNSRSFASFTRYDLSKISQLEIRGAVKISSVFLCK